MTSGMRSVRRVMRTNEAVGSWFHGRRRGDGQPLARRVAASRVTAHTRIELSLPPRCQATDLSQSIETESLPYPKFGFTTHASHIGRSSANPCCNLRYLRCSKRHIQQLWGRASANGREVIRRRSRPDSRMHFVGPMASWRKKLHARTRCVGSL